jgi:L-alanine-DL-glutamate epimerase-like enolase superfamily enzyme
MKIRVAAVDLETALPFVTAHGGGSRFQNVLVEVEHDGVRGIGEAAPSPYHGETAATVLAALASLIPPVEATGSPLQLEAIHAAMEHALAGHGAAKAAIDIACHDWLARRAGMPLAQLLGLDPEAVPPSSYTVPIVGPAEVPRAVESASAFGALKVKMGDAMDGARLRQVRAATAKPIRVDANGAWTAEQAIRRLPELEEAGVELLEQPVAVWDLDGLARIRRAARLPILADEPALGARDIPRLAGTVDGINIKLAKTGGILPALKMIHTARAHGLRVMLGCMVESSIGIAAAVHLSPLADWVDLDGHALLARDPARGFRSSAAGSRRERPFPASATEPVFARAPYRSTEDGMSAERATAGERRPAHRLRLACYHHIISSPRWRAAY